MSIKAAAIFVFVAAVLAAAAPVSVSAASVFLFAGPHNWLEARYFAARMPAIWGRRTPFFIIASTGVLLLSASFSLFPIDRSIWHTFLVLWVLALIRMERHAAFRDAVPAGLLWIGLAWLAPQWMDLVLVYLHPSLALWFLRRQIARSRPEVLSTLHSLLLSVPVLAALIVAIRIQSPLPPSGQATSFLALPASPAFIALHVFLELLHYGVWVFLLPAAGLAHKPWDLSRLPLVRHRLGWPRLTTAVFCLGALLVLTLWFCFAIDYSATRSVYFAFAVIHVLAEAPFLIWLR
jgi:hypothetical protein